MAETDRKMTNTEYEILAVVVDDYGRVRFVACSRAYAMLAARGNNG